MACSVTGVQAITWGSITNLDPFAEAISLTENEGATITSFVGNPLDTLRIWGRSKSGTSQTPLLGVDPAKPRQRTVFGVPLISSPAVEPASSGAADGPRCSGHP